MSWHIERNGRLFTVANELGRVMFDGAFRSDIPESMQVRALSLMAEAPEMLTALKGVSGSTERHQAYLDDVISMATEQDPCQAKP